MLRQTFFPSYPQSQLLHIYLASSPMQPVTLALRHHLVRLASCVAVVDSLLRRVIWSEQWHRSTRCSNSSGSPEPADNADRRLFPVRGSALVMSVMRAAIAAP